MNILGYPIGKNNMDTKKAIIPWNKGKKGVQICTEETRKKMSFARKGNKHPLWGKHFSLESRQKMSESHKGQKPWMMGKHHTEETKIKIALAKNGQRSSQQTEFKKGTRPWNYMGGTSTERMKIYNGAEYKQWRRSVWWNSDKKCNDCGEENKKLLQADHIQPWATFPKLRYDPDNGQLLCVRCHRLKTRYVDTYTNKYAHHNDEPGDITCTVWQYL